MRRFWGVPTRLPNLLVVAQHYATFEESASGAYWSACCPVHKDTNPSLVVWPRMDPPVWKCYGCGRGGDVVQFVQFVERCSVDAALTRLAEFPVEGPEQDPLNCYLAEPPEVRDERPPITRRRVLWQSIRAHLLRRGVTPTDEDLQRAMRGAFYV